MNRVTVILPTYNEEESIGPVIDEIMALPVDCDILVIDNGSTDETYNILTHKGVKVITEPKRGKGNAMQLGFTIPRTPYIIMMNSDYTYPAEEIPKFVSRLEAGYDIVIGERHWLEGNSMSIVNSFGNKVLSLLASSLYGFGILDVCSGMWGFSRPILDTFNITSEGFTLEVDLFVNAIKNGCAIAQIPIGYRSRLGNSNAKLKVGDGLKIGWFLIKNRWK
jgi:glycosyltransferase involved in cell wall biosynthesis